MNKIIQRSCGCVIFEMLALEKFTAFISKKERERIETQKVFVNLVKK
jgi:hypothetical protein